MFNLFSSTKIPPIDLPALQLYNTESRKLEVFTARKSGKVTMYSCGPTVYDFAHIGNLRAFVFADVLKRTLEYNGYSVNHTMNLTDFGHLTDDADAGEDKIMKGLKREGLEVSLRTMRELTDKYIAAFKADAESMEIIPPTQYTRASDFVKEQITLIKTLDEKGYTYETSDGVYFDISKFPTYGRLGNIDINTLKSGARVAENSEKKHPADFAVWKKGDLGWSSPWGQGFPGWHIECSAMAMATLGKQIDIHTGGVDNAPTHHNAEIAQCEAATGKQFVGYWLHSEHIQIEGDKIAKSAGNSINLGTLLEAGFSGAEYRYWLLTSHYRTQVNFSMEALAASKQALLRLRRFMYEDCLDTTGTIDFDYRQRFVEAINNDLDTPQAIALMHELLKETDIPAPNKRATIVELDSVLGFGLDLDVESGQKALGFLAATEVPTDIQNLLDGREAARVARNWAEADKLRDILTKKGYAIEDSAEGPKLTKI